MNIITLENRQLTYDVAYKKNRNSVQLKIQSSTHLEITAPTKFPTDNIEKILQQKSRWILKKILYLETVAKNPLNKTISHGATLLYLGRPHTLIFVETKNNQGKIYDKDQQIFIPIFSSTLNLKDPSMEIRLQHWYRQQAQQQLLEKTVFWSNEIAVQPQRITIKDQKTRWGSCSSKRNINYNWRIIMAPPAVIDYLVIHELCHLRFPNHSTLFWQEVARFSPNFKEHRTWLKNNGAMLMGIL